MALFQVLTSLWPLQYIDPQVFAIVCKTNHPNTVYRLKLDVDSVDVHFIYRPKSLHADERSLIMLMKEF